ncbi:hypothetical protein GE061_014435 [Apolygus lucorum]|uniref:Odorant receptor n=1 Tax=Apolygus lucorum TaxID=248454 RepID=A0A6A4KBW7_APOLU|nr:hypothetical protein GE061_014435 [Apolygus lucorum]
MFRQKLTSVNEELRHENVFNRHVYLLQFLGVTIPNKLHPERRWMDSVLFSTVLIIIVLNSISQVMTLFLHQGSLASKAVNLMFFLVNIVSIVKLVLIQSNAVMLSRLFEALDTPGATDSTTMLRVIGVITQVYVAIIFTLLAVFVASPWMTGSQKLPIPYWFPFDTDNFVAFTATYTFASIAFTIVAYTMEAVDTLLIFIAGQICRRLDAIQDALITVGVEEPLRKRGWKRYKAQEDNLGLGITRLAALSRDETLLRECIREHVDIIQLVRTFDIVLDDIFLAQVIQSTIVSTMSFFAASKLEDPFRDIPKLGAIIIGTFLQFFMYCWLGEEISDHSDDLHRTLYLSEWYKCREKIMKSLVIMQTFTKNHFRLEGGHLFNIDLRTFTLVLQESFGFFMVLRAVIR